MTFRGERCTGGKKPKARLTVVVGANMDGSEKLPLFVIGKTAKPRCFKNAKILINYAANSKAWMTSELFSKFSPVLPSFSCVIFEDYLKKWDRQLRSEQHHILIFVDTCPSHPDIDKDLENIRLKFFPPIRCQRASRWIKEWFKS